MPRIVIAGFQHETNSYGVGKAGLAEFVMADSWPGLLTGDAVVEDTRGMNLPIAGFAEAARREALVDLTPVLWCAAEPSGPVTDNAFETICGRIIDGVRQAGELDGLFLDLHGAMIAESVDDGEGELLRRLRELTGPDLPIAVSLDMHANITPAMVRLADSLCIYRTYPHLDMAETGARAFRSLMEMIAGDRPARALRQAPFLIPLHAQFTGTEPGRSLYAGLEAHTGSPNTFAEIAMGFTAGDTHDTGPCVVAHAPSRDAAERLAETVFLDLLRAEGRFDHALLTPEQAVARAIAAAPGKPVVIADVQDNPGAGASSDTTGLLVELVRQGARGVMLGLMHDPGIAALAHSLGAGAEFEAPLGGKSEFPGQMPFHARFRVESLGNGSCPYIGAMYRGGVGTLGPTAVLKVVGSTADVRIVVNSIRNQCLDRAHFTHLGLNPENARIVVVKSTAHFRADFDTLAQEVLLAAAPGAFACNLETVNYRKLRSGVRRGKRTSEAAARSAAA